MTETTTGTMAGPAIEPSGVTVPRSEESPSPHADRLEFVDAFVDHTRSAPSPDRLVARPHVAVFVAALAAVCAIVVGLIVGLFHSDRQQKKAAQQGGSAGSVAAPAAYTAVAGWDCPSRDGRSFTASGRTARWRTFPAGGWTGDDCKGSFVAVPMSGNPNADDPAQSALWTFMPGTAVNRCSVAVYNPVVDQSQIAAAPAVRFTVLAGKGGTAYGTFALDQTTAPGTWVEVGTFAVAGGQFAVQLGNRGAPARPQERLLVSQVRVTCRVVNQ